MKKINAIILLSSLTSASVFAGAYVENREAYNLASDQGEVMLRVGYNFDMGAGIMLTNTYTFQREDELKHGYNEIEEALMGEFYEFNENYLGYYHGTYASIWGADITGDGKMEWLSGNFRGGFQIFTPDNGTSITDAKPAPPVYIAPVPADNYIDVSWNLPESEDVVVECITLTGAIVFSATTNASTIRIDIADNWAPGMYLIRIRTANTNSIGKCIIR